MIALGPDVKPAGALQLLYYIADLERHNNQDNERPNTDFFSGGL